jgi:multidrug efflux pump subunit AcrA (membrane-fusion protein)
MGGSPSKSVTTDVNQQIQQLVSQIQNGGQNGGQLPSHESSSEQRFSKVTYEVVGDDNLLYRVTDVEPEEPYAKNEHVEIPVQVKVFVTRKGVPGYELAVAGGNGDGEEF